MLGGLIGYALGTRSGREQIDRIAARARDAWEDPRVQEKVADASHRASAYVQEMAPEIKDRVGDAVRQASDQLRSNGSV